MFRARLVAVVLASAAADASAQSIVRVNLSTTGGEANGLSLRPVISTDGRYVAYDSDASNLVALDQNGLGDIFLFDRANQTTVRVSVDSAGVEADGASTAAAISADGRFVAFRSDATNLAPGQTGAVYNIFSRDTVLGTTILVSRGLAGAGPNGSSFEPILSTDGRYVAYHSFASNLVAGDANNQADVFVFDQLLQQTSVASLANSGAQADRMCFEATISANGRFVGFMSAATNLVIGDTNDTVDIFLRDRQLGTTSVLSVSPAGQIGNSSSFDVALTPDARYAAFSSSAGNLVTGDTNSSADIFRRDLQTGVTVRVNRGPGGIQGDRDSLDAAISEDGLRIVFQSYATNLVPGDLNLLVDAFQADLPSSLVELISMGMGGVPANGPSATSNGLARDGPSISGDGRLVVFQSVATNLVPGDNNGTWDIFLRFDPLPPAVYCTAKLNSLGCSPSIGASGASSATAPSGFTISASSAINNKIGILLYRNSIGGSGQGAIPFTGGTLCFSGSPNRTTPVLSGGTPPPVNDCSGVFAIDMNSFAQGGITGPPFPQAFLLIHGQQVCAQFWGRDPGFAPPDNTQLTDGVMWVIGP